MAEPTLPSDDRLESRLEFEELLSDFSSRFINLPPGEVDREIEDALRRVCEHLGIDNAVLWQWPDAATGVATPTHVYYAQGASRAPEPLRQDQFPWVTQQMLAGRMVVVSSLDELPEEAAVDRESARHLGLKSNLDLPLAVGNDPPVGALSFNSLQAERAWPDALVTRLHLVAQVFTNALARRRHEQSLRDSEERLSLAADSAEAVLWTLDYGTGEFWVTERARTIFAYPPDEVVDLERFEASVHPDDRDLVRGAIERSAHTGEAVSAEYRIVVPGQGEVRWISSNGRPRFKPSGEPERLMGVSIDVTERKRAEHELHDLSQRLIHAHEEERALLARELHDDVTQRLAVLAIEVGRAELAAPHGTQAEALRSVREGLVRLSEDVHSLACQLHPSVLEELGLAEALKAECDRLRRRSVLELSLDFDPLLTTVGKEAALCLFRVAQEALNNAARHSGARSATVTLRNLDGGMVLAVRDDGVGFDPGHPGRSGNLGLASMRERVRLVNGTLDIESAPGRGTAVVAWAPAAGGSR